MPPKSQKWTGKILRDVGPRGRGPAGGESRGDGDVEGTIQEQLRGEESSPEDVGMEEDVEEEGEEGGEGGEVSDEEEEDEDEEEEVLPPVTQKVKPVPKPKPKLTPPQPSGKPQGKGEAQAKLRTPKADQKKRPPPSAPKSSCSTSKKQKPTQEAQTIELLSEDSAGEGPSTAATPPQPQRRTRPDDTVVIGTFRTHDADGTTWSTKNQVVAFLEGVGENEEPTCGNLRLNILPWTSRNDPTEFGVMPQRKGKKEHPAAIPRMKWRWINLRSFYYDYANSFQQWDEQKLFKIVHAELQLEWHCRH